MRKVPALHENHSNDIRCIIFDDDSVAHTERTALLLDFAGAYSIIAVLSYDLNVAMYDRL